MDFPSALRVRNLDVCMLCDSEEACAVETMCERVVPLTILTQSYRIPGELSSHSPRGEVLVLLLRLFSGCLVIIAMSPGLGSGASITEGLI